jgi:hypothetical protein
VTGRHENELPAYAAWRQLGAREGFEVAFFRRDPEGYCAIGQASAVEGDRAWAVSYRIGFDASSLTRTARVTSSCLDHESILELATSGRGEWVVDRVPAPQLDGCFDVDLEASVLTNALPVRRLRLKVGEMAQVPAAYVRAPTLRVERLEQTYERLPDCVNGTQRYAYHAPSFGFSAELSYDAYGLLLKYPGIGIRWA